MVICVYYDKGALDQRFRRALRKYPVASISTLRETNDLTIRIEFKVQ